MTAKFYEPVDLVYNELRNFLAQSLGSAPGTGAVGGRIYYDTSTTPGKLYYHNGTTWVALIAAGTGDVVGPASSVASQMALFDLTTGKLLKASTLTATVTKSASGVLSAATVGTDYSGGTSALATGMVKSTTTTGALTIGTAGTDYSAGTASNSTGLVKSTTTTGALTTAVQGTDYYAPAGTDVAIVDGGTGVSTLPSGLLKGAGTGAITAAAQGTDYYAPTGTDVAIVDGGTGVSTLPTGLLKGAGTGAITAATSGTDYSAGTNALATGIVKSTTSTGALTIAVAGTDYYNPGGTDVAIVDGGTGVSTLPTGLLKGAGTGAITAASAGTDYYNPGGTDVAIVDGGTGVSTLPSGLLKGAGTGAITAAVSSTDYAPATSGSAALKGNGSGGFGTATLNDVGAATADYSLASHKLTLVTDPTSAQDAATKNYVDAVAANVHDYKDSVAVATTAVLPNTPTYANGTSGLGATLTSTGNAAFPAVDGITLTSGSVNPGILVANQASAFQNGIYTVTQTGSGAAPWILTRRTDADTTTEVTAGAQVPIESGTANGGQVWNQTTTGAITIGTTAQAWSFYFKATSTQAGAGLTATGNVFDVAANADATIIVNADDIQVNKANITRHAETVLAGQNGVLTSFAWTHGYTLANKYAQNISVWDTTTNEKVFPTITATSTTVSTIDFGVFAPAASQMYVFGTFGA